MDPQILYNCSYILLAAGIILLILNIVLFFRFGMLGIIRSEIAERRETAESGSEGYFARVVSRVHNETGIEENKVFEDKITVEQYAPEEERTPTVQKAQAEQYVPDEQYEPEETDESIDDTDPSITVLVSGSKKESTNGETVVKAKNKKRDLQDDDYRIIDSIIVIHGDPHAIK